MRYLILFLFMASTSLANNPGVSYQGRIIKPDGTPLEGNNVQFRMQVRSPGSENCLLYEEIQSINMSSSSGVFAVTLNDGTGTRLDTPTYQIDRIFANRDSMTLDSSRCAVGTVYTPNSVDGRKFVVYFKEETMAAYEPLPIMSLNYAPQAIYALESQKVGSFGINTILRAVDVSGNPVSAPALDPTQLTNLTNLLAGTSTLYATANQFGTVQSFAKSAPPMCGAGEVLKSNGTTLSCVTAGGTPSLPSTGATSTNSIDSTNYAQTWNWSTATTESPLSMSANALTTGSVLKVSTSSSSLNSTSGLINVANTSASTSGILARFQSNSTAGSGLTVLANGNVGIGTTSPGSPLVVGTSAANTSSMSVETNPATWALLNLSTTSTTYTKTDGSNNPYGYLVNLSTPNVAYQNGIGWTTSGSTSGPYAAIIAEDTDGASNFNYGALAFRTRNGGNLSTRMYISDSGNVGIGNSSPGTLLEIGTSGSTGYRIKVNGEFGSVNPGLYILNSTGDSAMRMTTTAGDFYIGVDQSDSGKFKISRNGGPLGTNDALVIENSNGHVGIGTTSPATTLQVEGVISPATNNSYSLGNMSYKFTEVFATNGVINTSDRREKKDIFNTDLGLNFINKLRPVSYRWSTGVDSDIHYGLIAQEAEQAIAESGQSEKTSIVTHDETTDRYGVRYSELISPLIKAVQELYIKMVGADREIASVKEEVSQLKSENEKLKQENEAIKARLEKIENALNSK